MKKLNLYLIFLFFIFCSKKTGSEPVTLYGVKIDKETEPIKIAEILIRALDEENDTVLQKLVAVNTERTAILELYKKYSQKPKKISDENIRKLTSSGWLLTYSFFEKGNTYITGDKVGKDSAFVYASGLKVNGERRTMVISLIKENGYWRVLGGIKEY